MKEAIPAKPVEEVIELSSDEEEIEIGTDVEVDAVENTEPVEFNTPLKTPVKTPGEKIPLQNSNQNTPSVNKMTPKQLAKQKEKEEREKKRLEEKLAKERAKEEEKKLKEEMRLQKEAQKLAEKKAKEDEKRAREEERERARKEAEEKREQARKEKEEKERKKLEEKLKKEEEKRKKEEEKLKKEEEKKKKEEAEIKKKEKLKISNFFKPKSTLKSTTTQPPVEATSTQQLNDYKTTFQDFFVKEGVILDKSNRLKGSALTQSISDFDTALQDTTPLQSDLRSWLKTQQLPTPETRPTAEYIYENQLSGAPIKVKFIKFYENVKSWIGTYTKYDQQRSLGVDPCKELPMFIDFDDDAGEDEEGEGEDIDDEDDDEEEEEDSEDLQDFLEEDNGNGDTRKFVGPLIPVVTWRGKSSAENDNPVVKIEILKADVSFPIDPSRDYWKPTAPLTPAKSSEDTTEDQPKPKKMKTVITVKEDLELFAAKVQDMDFTAPTMVEILKKELPKYTKATIENTLRSLAKRVGPKPTEKKWEVNREMLDQLVEVNK